MDIRKRVVAVLIAVWVLALSLAALFDPGFKVQSPITWLLLFLSVSTRLIISRVESATSRERGGSKGVGGL
jgi:hypothetical protein